MKDNFSTFDIVKILGINRNTLQSAIASRYIVPDIQSASKRDGERARFSRKGVYQVSLFFKLLQFGKTRLEASMESNVNWENVGNGPDRSKYLVCSGDISDSPSMKVGGLELYERMPENTMQDNEAVRLIVNLVAVKNEIDRRITD